MAGPRFPYREWRRGQREAAQAVARAVGRGSLLVLNAPTGFGKTAAIIYGLLEAGAERVLYLVRTRNEVAPVIRELTRFGVEDFTFLYSARRMCPLLRGEDVGVEDFWETCRLLRLRGECRFYRELATVEMAAVKRVVAGASSPFRAVELLVGLGVCPFFALKMLVGESRFIVATYPYLFRRDIFAGVFEGYDYNDFTIVVDEAHSLLQSQGLVEARLTSRDIEAAIREVEEYGLPGQLAERLRKLASLIASGAPSEPRRLKRLDISEVRRLLGDPETWSDAAYEVRVEKLRRALEAGGSPRVVVRLAKVESFAALASQEEGVGVYAYRTDTGQPAAAALPLDPCIVTREPLNAARSVVLASGTMPPAELVTGLLCVERSVEVYDAELLHGPVTPPESRYTILTLELTSRYTERSPGMYMLYASYIIETYRVLKKSLLVVYPSYEFMESVVAAVKSLARHEPMRLLVEDKATTVDTVAEALAEGKTLVNAVAGGKLVEGVEFTSSSGSLLGGVFIAGIPYPQPDDYLHDQLTALSKRLGAEKARTLLYDVSASIKVRQAIGRVQRSPEDRALIVLGDSRFARRRLRELLRLRVDHVAVSIEDYRRVVAWAAEKLHV